MTIFAGSPPSPLDPDGIRRFAGALAGKFVTPTLMMPALFHWAPAGDLGMLSGMEGVLPPQTQSGAGFEPTYIRQFTVFLENRVGRLQSLVRTIEESAGRICGLSIEESAESALVRLICADADVCRDALTDAGFTFGESDLLAVELPRDDRSPISELSTALLVAEINIHYAYPLLSRPRGPALALYVEDPILAARLLIRKGYTLIGESDLGPADV